MTGIIEAERVIALHQKKAPDQTIDIAQELGIKVFKVHDWPETVSAMLRKAAGRCGKSDFTSYVNGWHTRVSRGFSVDRTRRVTGQRMSVVVDCRDRRITKKN